MHGTCVGCPSPDSVPRLARPCREMEAIVEHYHEPALGAKDITVAELNMRGPLFQYWVLLKVSKRWLLALCTPARSDLHRSALNCINSDRTG